MRKAGIFDPWRQEEEVPETPAKDGWDDGVATPHCIQFRGVKAGINVWLPTDELEDVDAQKRARAQIVRAVYAVRNLVPEVLAHYDIFPEKRVQSGAVYLTDGGHLWVTVLTGFHTDDDRRRRLAIALLASAFRYALKRLPEKVKLVLDELGIKPFVM